MKCAFQSILKHTLLMTIQIKTNYLILLNLMCMEKNNRYNIYFVSHGHHGNSYPKKMHAFSKLLDCSSIPPPPILVTCLRITKFRHFFNTLTHKYVDILFNIFCLLKSKKTDRITKITKVKSILQKQATKRFLHRAQKLKTWHLKEAFAAFYTNVNGIR